MSIGFWVFCGVITLIALALGRVMYFLHYATRREFLEHKRQWRKGTGGVSSLTVMFRHPSYQAIIRMGQRVVPFIIEDLKQNGPEHWFHALTAITGAQPVRAEDAGDIVAMTRTWLDWWDVQRSLE